MALLAAAAVTASATLVLGSATARPIELALVGAPGGEQVELTAGQARLADLAGELARRGRPRILHREGKSWLLASTLVVRGGARLSVHAEELRLRSEPGAFVGLEAHGGAIDLTGGAVVTSWDPLAGEPDQDPGDGRAWILARDRGRLSLLDARLRMLGYDTPERYGVAWHTPGTGGEVVGATITGNWYGLSAWRSAPLLVRDSVIERAHRHGLQQRTCLRAAPAGGVVIEGSTFRDNGGHGVVLAVDCGGAAVRGNRAERNGGAGILVHGGSAGVLVDGNETSGNQGTGIAVGASTGTRVVGNLAYGNAHGVAVDDHAAGTVLERNRLTANRGDGIRVTGEATLAVARANVADANHRAGVLVDGAAASLGPGNELTGNDVGIWVTVRARQVRLTGNRVAGNNVEDLRLELPAVRRASPGAGEPERSDG